MSIKYRHNERLKSMTSQGYKVLYDPPADCNCQFSSVAFALRDLGFFKSANTFRNDVISYMDTYDVSADEYPMELFAATPWSDKSYSDEIIIHFQYQNHGCLNSCTGRTRKKNNKAATSSNDYLPLAENESDQENDKPATGSNDYPCLAENESAQEDNEAAAENNENFLSRAATDDHRETSSYLDRFSVELLQKIFFFAQFQSDNTFSNHVKP